MHFDWSTLALQTVNFAVLVWLLHRFLYRPVLRMVDARRAEIEKQYDSARATEAQARERLAAIEGERAGIANERAAVCHGAAIEFGVDPTLVGGAELHFPNAILRFSWKNALAIMRAEIEADANAG
jgi:hypothetical protein